MRTLFILLASILTASAAHVQWNFADFTANPVGVKRVQITPLSTPATNNGSIISLDRKTYTNLSSGLLTVSNVVAGTYRVELIGPQINTSISNNIPDTNGLISASDYMAASLIVPGSTVAYPQVQADARFWSKDGLRPGTNTTYRTNGNGIVYIDTQAGGGGGSATNAYQSAAGPGITINTNGFLYTISANLGALLYDETEELGGNGLLLYDL